MSEENTPESLLEVILKALVTEPEEVKVVRTVDEMGVLLTVKVGKDDAGLVIGRQGRIIQAIRVVVSSVGSKEKSRINIKLDVPEVAPPRKKEDMAY